MLDTLNLLQQIRFPPINRAATQTLQVNLGYRCNQSCLHCHVAASPKRTESMQRHTAEWVLALLECSDANELDLTGGAPELNGNFRFLVESARAMGKQVKDRCNLTVLQEPGQEDLAAFLAAHQVQVIASLPCYLQENVDAQRGQGIYQRSLLGLKQLNALGYGQPGSGLELNLVYNPVGISLPPDQQMLEADYRTRLGEHGIAFNHLYCIANMPINRFGSQLLSKGQFQAYMTLLQQAHQPANEQQVMCRSLISIDWQGFVYDCDFNQMLGLPLPLKGHPRPQIQDLLQTSLDGNLVTVAGHCFGCTAGQGSSCGGALA